MSDIDDLLSEFSAPAGKQGYDRYMPDPAEAMKTYDSMAQGGWDSIKQGASQLGQFGSDPLSRIKGAGNIALGGAQWAGAIPAAFGKYLGAPIGRAVEDATGSPTAGHIVGGTAELAPALMVPFPGASAIKAGPEAASMVAGELPAARMATEGALTKFGARGAKAATSDDGFDDLVEELTSRKTSAAKDVEYRAALAELQRRFKPGVAEEGSRLPPMSAPVPKDIRLLHKGNPKVGERKYAQDESGNPVVMKGYQDFGDTPTYRTSHSPRMPQEPEAPVGQYQNIFQREIAGESPISQMPLAPGTRPEVLDEMWLPNVRENTPIDPNLLAELKLKFGGGSPQGAMDNPAWLPQQTAGVRPPAQMPIYGARPTQEATPNVIMPESPVPMGTQARETPGRLRNDMGLPPDATQALQRGRTARQEELARQPETPPPELTPASAPKAVTQYGNIEVGQPYDIVMKMNGQEMRSAGGTVKELLYKDEPVVEAGKSVMKPVGYAVLEDGRQVPVKLLQRSGTAEPNIKMSAPATEAMPKPSKISPPPVASGQQSADPAFAAVQKKMSAKTAPAAAEETKGASGYTTRELGHQIMKSRPVGKYYYAQIKKDFPGATRGEIDKAIDFLKTKNERLNRQTDKDAGDQFMVVNKATHAQKVDDKAARFDEIFAQASKDKKFGYLHNFQPATLTKMFASKGGNEVSAETTVNGINRMIKNGTIKVYPEGQSDKPLKKVNLSDLSGDDDIDFVVEYLQGTSKMSKAAKADTKSKLSKAEVRSKSHDLLKTTVKEKGSRTEAVLDLEDQFNRGDITGTEFLSALKALEKKGKK